MFSGRLYTLGLSHMKFIRALSIVTFGSLVLNTQVHASDRLTHIDKLSNYPEQMQEEFNELKRTCADFNFDNHPDSFDYDPDKGRPSYSYGDYVPLYVERGFISKADITGDGTDDYIVNYGKLSCEYAASAWGAADNAPHTVYMGTRGDNAYRLYEQYNMDSEDYPKLILNNQGYSDIQRIGMGGECGQKGNWSVAETQYCKVTERWNKENSEMDLVSIKNLSYL